MRESDRRVVAHGRAPESKVDTAAWGLFFVWVGIALLADVGWGLGLVGVAAITFGAQVWRRHVGLSVDRFSLVVGVLFAVGGIWNLFDVRVEFVPVLCIVAGLALLVSTLVGRSRSSRATRGQSGAEAAAHPPS